MIISVDLGQATDFTAISVIKREGEELQVIHLERFPLGMAYPEQVKRITDLYKKLKEIYKEVPTLVLDRTGVGRGIVDLLQDVRLISITITGGNVVTKDGRNWNVPKRDLIHGLVVQFQTGKIKIVRSLPDAEILIKELLNFKMKVNITTGHDSYEAWREGIHDDLVLSVAMGAYVESFPKPCAFVRGRDRNRTNSLYSIDSGRRIG